MKERGHSIVNSIISEEEIRRKLPSIFTDSIILDSAYKMVVVSNNILDLLEFRSTELYGKDVNYIAGSFDLIAFLDGALRPGFFQEKYLDLFSKSNRPVLTAVSGFYLGLISDINGYIILKVHDARSLQALHKEREAKRVELDNFIYRTAHDLRGPLATIRGLINLYRLKKDEFDVDHLMQLISLHAEQLDEKLFKLLYLAEADQIAKESCYCLDVREMETHLRKRIESSSFVDSLDFQVHASDQIISGVDEILIFALAGNILHFLLSLANSTVHNHQLIFFVSRVDDVIEMKIRARGFEINEDTRNIINNSDTFYGDMLIHPELFNYFASLKIALRLRASIYIKITNEFNHEIVVSIPISKK
ncbi:MAG TPA: hypothetical protein VFW11_04870 [Cyclobacteriaceae bacterium]|nr:hypothetical protein [Cyclobacteriaceae bacterium]